MLKDQDIFPYGKYKTSNTTMEEVPAWYLLGQHNYFKDKDVTPDSAVDQMIKYVEDNMDELIKERSEV